jgi:hypothetical protein
MNIEQIEVLRVGLQESFDLLVQKVNKIQIGNKEQFPFGWRKSAKGRTVWRILEELIIQNLEQYYQEFNLQYVRCSNSEISVYDFECKIVRNNTPIFVNIKSAVLGGRASKDDISKGDGLKLFYDEDVNKNFFIGTFVIKFNDDMTVEIDHAVAFPIVWIPDIYINPSNNGNFQSSKYKNLKYAVKRCNADFYPLFSKALTTAIAKRKKKLE